MDGIGKDANGNFFVHGGVLCEAEQCCYCKCPVCGGNGLVPNGFYSSTTGRWSSTSITPENCRSCDGHGYIRV